MEAIKQERRALSSAVDRWSASKSGSPYAFLDLSDSLQFWLLDEGFNCREGRGGGGSSLATALLLSKNTSENDTGLLSGKD